MHFLQFARLRVFCCESAVLGVFFAMTLPNEVLAAEVKTNVRPYTKLGSYAQNYVISEPALDDVLTIRIAEARKAETAITQNQDWKTATTKFFKDPPVTPGVIANRAGHSVRYVDPTFAVQTDVFGPDGKLAFSKGEKFNPLKYFPVSKPQLYFDARDSRQVFVARSAVSFYKGAVQLVAVGGSPILAANQLGHRVFYDYAGTFSSRFKISKIPALVTQEQSRFRVDELPLTSRESGKQ